MTDDYDTIFHIGASKSGSSSIQRQLTLNPDFQSSQGKAYKYVVITKDGQVLHGKKLKEVGLSSPYGYMSTVGVYSRNKQFNIDSFVRARDDLHEIIDQGNCIILSCEGWSENAKYFRENELLEKLQLRPRIIMFIRPPIDWLNAAWWQWGAWSGHSFDRWYRGSLKRVYWDEQILLWKELPMVKEVEFDVATDNVLELLANLLGCEWAITETSNVSTSPILLRYLQANRDLRPEPHSPRFEFILNRWIDWSNKKAPWIVPTEYQENTIEAFKPHLANLLASARPWVREKIEKDLRWWSTTPYQERKVECELVELSEEEREELIRMLIDGVVRADAEYRKLICRR